MTDLVLVRHGETVWHAENRYAGRSDVALTEHGLREARALAAWAGHARPDAVVSSPQQRARRTAELAAEAADRPLRVDERLVEVDFGKGDGLTRAEMSERFPTDLEAFRRSPASHPLPGGELGTTAVARARPAFAALCREYPDGRVLVVAHQTLMRLMLCALLDIALDRYRTVFPRLDNVALTTVRVPGGLGGPTALLGLNVPAGRDHGTGRDD